MAQGSAESIQNYFLDQMKKAGLYYNGELSDIEESQELLSALRHLMRGNSKIEE